MISTILTLKRSERFKSKLKRDLPVHANLFNGDRFRIISIDEEIIKTQCGKTIELKLIDNFD
jgi:hypothetical protein